MPFKGGGFNKRGRAHIPLPLVTGVPCTYPYFNDHITDLENKWKQSKDDKNVGRLQSGLLALSLKSSVRSSKVPRLREPAAAAVTSV